jgi:hypothetical protein
VFEVAIPSLPAPHALTGSSAAVLRAIRDPAVTLAVWLRPSPRGLRAVADALAARAPFSMAVEERPGPATARVTAGLPGSTACGRTRLAADIASLAALFAEIAGTARVRIRLDAIHGPACRLFHADHVGLRLLCTYAGPGTEWVPDHAVDRAALGDNARAISRHSAVRRLPRFAVGLFKGEAFPGNAGRGIVHRSPPVRGTPRLLLCIDEPGRF